jgi:hypothetical protein
VGSLLYCVLYLCISLTLGTTWHNNNELKLEALSLAKHNPSKPTYCKLNVWQIFKLQLLLVVIISQVFGKAFEIHTKSMVVLNCKLQASRSESDKS